MTEPVTRGPYDHALAEINTTAENLRGIESLPDGRPRDLSSTTAVGVLTIRSNLAIASALLAIADSLRDPAAGSEGR
jgi:hypothetical protein